MIATKIQPSSQLATHLATESTLYSYCHDFVHAYLGFQSPAQTNNLPDCIKDVCYSRGTVYVVTTRGNVQKISNGIASVIGEDSSAVCCAVSLSGAVTIGKPEMTLVDRAKLPFASNALAYSPCGSFIVSSSSHLLRVTCAQTYQTKIVGVSLYTVDTIAFSGCGLYIGVLYVNGDLSVLLSDGFVKVIGQSGVHSFCWMDLNVVVLNMQRLKWSDVESTFKDKRLVNLSYDVSKEGSGLLRASWSSDQGNTSLLMKVLWNPCLRVEEVKRVEGRVCGLDIQRDKIKVSSVVDDSTVCVYSI